MICAQTGSRRPARRPFPRNPHFRWPAVRSKALARGFWPAGFNRLAWCALLGLWPWFCAGCSAGNGAREGPISTPTARTDAWLPRTEIEPELVFDLAFEPISAALTRPVFLTHAGDGSGRLFIVEQKGLIRIWRAGELLSEPFLDLTDRFPTRPPGDERGLLGLAFAPDFMQSLHFYVNYTGVNGHSYVSRFNVSPIDPNRALIRSEEVILKVRQPRAEHNGGMLAFGPDGMLWIGLGDGGGLSDPFGNAQNPASLLGKMLRLDVSSPQRRPYAIPPDNPRLGRTARPEIWALGLRNPWRYSFDRETGDLWIADVGETRFEEVHVAWADRGGGLNFGWPVLEGNHCLDEANCDPQGLERAVAEFAHAEGACSITGGYVYRGRRAPEFQGQYVAADYCEGSIFRIENAGSRQAPQWSVKLLARTDFNVSSFGEDEAGELYLVDYRGAAYRMRFARKGP